MRVAVIGGGPAGLMAAETLVAGGVEVDVFDAMASVGRKFLLAGKGGMNITHTEALPAFVSRYGVARETFSHLLDGFGPAQLVDWMHGLGVASFVGSSGRVFPVDMKAAPLLRAWLHRLRASGVRFHVRHRWQGWDGAAMCFATPHGQIQAHTDALVLATGGGSWARLGSDGAWVAYLQTLGVAVARLQPSNCGFDVGWSAHFQGRFGGQPLKSIALSYVDTDGQIHRRVGELMLSDTGVEGSLIYAASAVLREAINRDGSVTIHLDMAPDKSLQRLSDEIAHPRGSRSVSSHLQSRTGIKGAKMALLREVLAASDFAEPTRLANAIKSLPLKLLAPRPLDEAISSAGGVMFAELDRHFMLRKRPGVFCAGEMLDWEAPTGGYLLTGCFATGRAAGLGALHWLNSNSSHVKTD